MDKDGRVYFIDWPDACVGPAVLDIAFFLSSVSAESGFSTGTLLGVYVEKAGRQVEKKNLGAALAVISGYLADNAGRTVPQKLPRLRWVQKSVLHAALLWLESLEVVEKMPEFRNKF